MGLKYTMVEILDKNLLDEMAAILAQQTTPREDLERASKIAESLAKGKMESLVTQLKGVLGRMRLPSEMAPSLVESVDAVREVKKLTDQMVELVDQLYLGKPVGGGLPR